MSEEVSRTSKEQFYRVAEVIRSESECKCPACVMWTIVYDEDGVTEIGTSWQGDDGKELAEDICDLMNMAFEAGQPQPTPEPRVRPCTHRFTITGELRNPRPGDKCDGCGVDWADRYATAQPPVPERLERLEAALRKIARWHGEFPPTERTWDDGSPMSYAACFGSNGERDYMRQVALDALKERPTATKEGGL